MIPSDRYVKADSDYESDFETETDNQDQAQAEYNDVCFSTEIDPGEYQNPGASGSAAVMTDVASLQPKLGAATVHSTHGTISAADYITSTVYPNDSSEHQTTSSQQQHSHQQEHSLLQQLSLSSTPTQQVQQTTEQQAAAIAPARQGEQSPPRQHMMHRSEDMQGSPHSLSSPTPSATPAKGPWCSEDDVSVPTALVPVPLQQFSHPHESMSPPFPSLQAGYARHMPALPYPSHATDNGAHNPQPASNSPPTSQQQPTPAQQLAVSQHQLAKVIQQSIEFTKAADRLQEMQKHIDVLSSRLAATAAERDKAEAALVEQTKLHETSQQRIREQYEARLTTQQRDYEARLADKQKDITSLKVKLERLEAQGAKGKLLTSASEVKLSGDELAQLRKAIEEQEVLINGYQQENETAMKRIKELEEQVKQSEAMAADGILKSERQFMATMDEHRAKNAETATKLKQILNLQRELEGLREQWSTREAELKAQVDKLRAGKKELEAKAAGVSMTQMKEDDALVAQLRQQLDAMKQQYSDMVSELQAKVRWHAENQELVSKNDSLVREQQELILKLEHRLALYEGPQSKGTQQRLRELQTQVTTLSAALKNRHPPRNLAALLDSVKPDVEDSAVVKELQLEVDQLKATLARKDEEYENRLRSYQQQYEALKTQFEERAAAMAASRNESGTSRQRLRVQELERQLEESRTAHNKKIRELESKLRQQQQPGMRSSSAGSDGGVSSSQVAPVGRRDDAGAAAALRQKDTEIRRLQQELERKTKQVAEMHLKLGEAQAKVVRLGEGLRQSHQGTPQTLHSSLSSPIRAVTPFKLFGHQSPRAVHPSDAGAGAMDQGGALMAQLQQRCLQLTHEVEMLRQQLSAAHQQLNAAHQQMARPQPDVVAAAHAEIDGLRRRLEAADMAMNTVQRAHTEAVEKSAVLQAEHQRTLMRLHDDVTYKEAAKWQDRVAKLEKDLASAQSHIRQLEQDLASARSRQHWAPEAAHFAALERKLDEMEQEQAAREARWRGVLEDTKNLYAMQQDMLQRKWELALEGKNAEIEKFKIEVDGLINATKKLQIQQQLQFHSPRA